MPEITCSFMFSPGQKVKTPWGDIGIVTMACLNEDGGKDYFVKRCSDSDWFRAHQLEAVKD